MDYLSSGSEEDYFGWSVDNASNTIVVGGPRMGASNHIGAVVVFEHDDGWIATQVLHASNATINARFGDSVSLQGPRLAVGAPRTGQSSVGSAYLFEHSDSGWVQSALLIPHDGQSFDGFGESIALWDQLLAVGAPDHVSGAVYVFRELNGTWDETWMIQNPDVAGSDFGYSLDLRERRLAVGTRFPDASHLFELHSPLWDHVASVQPDDGAPNDWFGWAVALEEEGVWIGSPRHAHSDGLDDADGGAVYRATEQSGWNILEEILADDQQPGEAFGASVAASWVDFVTTLVFGAPGGGVGGSGTGAVYVYDSERGKDRLLASDARPGDAFGAAVAMVSEQPGWIAIGAPGAFDATGAVYMFRSNATEWTESQRVLAPSACSGAGFGTILSMRDDRLWVGAPGDCADGTGAGAVYAFALENENWILHEELTASDGEPGDGFGLALDFDGERAVVGAPMAQGGAGSVWVFELQGTTWTERQARPNSPLEAGDRFGAAVSIDGKDLAVGTPGRALCAGAAFVFRLQGEDWVEVDEIAREAGAVGDELGSKLLLSGSALVAGAPGRDDSGIESGGLVTFRRVGITWSEDFHLLASDGRASDRLGDAIAPFVLSSLGGTFLVGAPGRDLRSPDAGAAYEFSIAQPPLFVRFCPGDGSGAPCPCGNEFPAGTMSGCRNSILAVPELEWGTGSTSVSADDIELVASGLPVAQTAILFAGTTGVGGGSGAPFGDGLSCVGGSVIRLGLQTTTAGGGYGSGANATFGPGLSALGGWQAGDSRNFQVWYRDPDGPCGSGFNLTNAMEVQFGF